jgi:hypothetical protein
MDLYREQWDPSKGLKVKQEWVKGHQDVDIQWNTVEDLNLHKLDHSVKLNILYD